MRQRRQPQATVHAGIGRQSAFIFVLIESPLPMQFADRLQNVETSAIRELFKLLGKPGIISFAGGFPDSALFDVDGIRAASQQALQDEPGAAL